ncbi:MAG TPA: efflux RND transporter permease subunit [Chromatiales bacterium]|nr:efflux RND transporter permease subunit [Chromatiales bacterium]
MSFVERLLRRPHAVVAFTLVAALLGLMGYRAMPVNLFPDSNRPTVAVVTQWPGATADDVAREVTHPIEVRLSALDGVRRVTSTSRDQVSQVSVEFEYGNDIDLAAVRVETELKRVAADLPEGTRESLIFRITDAAHPALVLAVTAAEGSGLDLAQVRRLAENPLRDRLLNVPQVAEVEVFGGEIRQVAVDLERDRLVAHDLDVRQVAAALAADNDARPAGFIERDGYRLLLTTRSLARGPEDLAQVLVPVKGGGFVRVGDLGTVHWGHADLTSWYRGNDRPAVAVAVLRGEHGTASAVLEQMRRALPAVRAEFPMLDIQIADTQGRLIDLTVSNMLDALRDAVIMAVLVILIFLGDTRAALVTALSLPFTYLLTFAVMWLAGMEFNMVTLTAVIIAVGMLVDDAIVVIENIERRIQELGESGLVAASRGTAEVMLPVLSGTLSNFIVLLPIIFIGGYVQTVLRPLSVSLTIALIASFIVSVTIIPLLAPWLLRPGARDPLGWLLRPFDRFVLEPLKRFYNALVGWGLNHRVLVLVVFFGLFVFSLKQMPVVGRELMPLMDTGIFLVSFEAEPDTDEAGMQRIAAAVDRAVQEAVPADWLISSSTVVGSEAGVRAFGSARTFQQGLSTVNLVDRFHRDRSIYEIEQDVRERVRAIPGLIAANVTEYGATPLSSIRGTVDVMITGPDWRVLDRLADEVVARLSRVRGLTGVERSWQGGSRRVRLDVDPLQAHHFGLTVDAVARQVAAAIGGVAGGRLRVSGENPIPVWVRLAPGERNDPEMIAGLPIRTPDGRLIPLSNIATVSAAHEPASHTHQALLPTVDVIGYRRNVAVTHLQEGVEAALADLELPRGYRISHEGEIKQMGESFGRLLRALGMGLALLYLSLAVTFRSFLSPLAILVTLPLAVIGAAWAMMLADKHGCMPSFMGLILLMGIVVKNGILLVDFIQVARAEGKDLRTAILEAVRLRTRPILMTAGSTIVGMIPIALEWAVGIERLSPLAVVAIGGLIAGTFLTLLVVPVLFSSLESLRIGRGQQAEPGNS